MRSTAQKESFFGAVRRRTLICCRNVQISASSITRDRIRSTTIQPMSLQRSLIAHDHRPILDRLPSRIRFATGTAIGASVFPLKPPGLPSDAVATPLCKAGAASECDPSLYRASIRLCQIFHNFADVRPTDMRTVNLDHLGHLSPPEVFLEFRTPGLGLAIV